MLALILSVEFGWRAGVIELLAEVAICLAVVGGGSGGRVAGAARSLFAGRRRRRLQPSLAKT
jgi:hypothetical protein